MSKIVAHIPDEIYKKINEEINLGIFSDTSEAVVSALKKAYASILDMVELDLTIKSIVNVITVRISLRKT
jgi:Arc/MetJ-type ribon-helix-helix transcriptional regulator